MDKTKSIENLRQDLNEMSTIMYNIYIEWKVSQRNPLTDVERMAETMYRMMIFKAKSIWQMSEGIVIVSTQKRLVADPSTIYPVLRSLYELLFLFRCMYVCSKNDVERSILLKIWNIRSNNNLIQISDVELDDKYQRIKKQKKEENEKLKNEVRELMHELYFPQTIKKTIEHCLEIEKPILKGFTFIHSENCDLITDFKGLDFSNPTIGVELSGESYIYSHYSAHSHPSFLGVKHFEEMYYSKDEDQFMKEILESTCLYLVRFMTDFCRYKDSYHSFYNLEESHINNILNRIILIQQDTKF